ncbi:uncharacterized protein Bfra_004704 [Botrytis fragariae]|uniref:Uncharacterized protein n=1 Tax=Botrytis fragariae TaxID=1964551 RepID=A0A8H6AVX6_9HELO|nr:uncharacterized protein Bfra_004704 [Botrytis fragariae]KAF5874689.1 hypothetical protein Bfra_004704 [Botrytis fragariae]
MELSSCLPDRTKTIQRDNGNASVSSRNSKICANSEPDQGICDIFRTVLNEAWAANDHMTEPADPNDFPQKEDLNQQTSISHSNEGLNNAIPNILGTGPEASQNKMANGRVMASAILGLNGKPLRIRTIKKSKLRMAREAESRTKIGESTMSLSRAQDLGIVGTDGKKVFSQAQGEDY